jgi:tetratricopeptide (TPR) repeat protein
MRLARRAPPGARLAAVLVPLLLASGCWTEGARSIPDTRSRYDHLPEAIEDRFADARASFDRGELEAARLAFQRLAQELPDNVVLGVWQQEAEIALAAQASAASRAAAADAPPSGAAPAKADPAAAQADAGTPAAPADPPPAQELTDRYASAAAASPTVTRLVLAARLEPDDAKARAWLDRAGELDPRCAWVHYGRAWLAAKRSAWDDVRQALQYAEECDAGHMPTRWLSAWMLARGGRVAQAISAFETWVAKAEEDPRVDARLLLEARLDLAILYVLDGDAGRAQSVIEGLDPSHPTTAREELIVAAAAQAEEQLDVALAAARRAAELAPGEILPLVQQALLAELWLDDPAAAEVAWTQVLAISRNAPDVSSLLERMRARVRLERHRRAREAQPPGSASEPRR